MEFIWNISSLNVSWNEDKIKITKEPGSREINEGFPVQTYLMAGSLLFRLVLRGLPVDLRASVLLKCFLHSSRRLPR